MSGFQTQVNLDQAPAVEGDFASANARMSANAIPGGLIAGDLGVTIARFGWIDRTTDQKVDNFNTGDRAPDGFIHREQQGLITVYLDEVSMMVPKGFPITLLNQGDFWVKLRGNAATIGQKAFASLSDGSVRTAAPGATIAGFVGTATFATNVMTVASVTSGTVKVGDIVTSSGVAAGTTVLAQTGGTPGGAGTYTLSTSPGTITPAQAVTTTGYIETKFVVDTAGSDGDLIKISSWG